jgi:hypothetical protein
MGWSIYYELAWDAPLDAQVRARVASNGVAEALATLEQWLRAHGLR